MEIMMPAQNTIKKNVLGIPIFEAIYRYLKRLIQATKRIRDIFLSIIHIYYYFYVHHVEYYQPLYSFQLFRTKVPQRPCVDRAEHVYDALKHFGNGGRILDVGCSLGYFSHYFAERHYRVTGIDSNPYNIAICKRIKKINRASIQFSVAEFSIDFLESMREGQYDVAFIFSVLHHILHDKGLAYTEKLLDTLLNKIPILFVELAIKEEATQFPWCRDLPDDALSLFAQCKNITVTHLGYSPTHLSSVARPLYMVQKKTMIINKTTYPLLSQKFNAYQGSPVQGRHFYDCDTLFIKRYYTQENEEAALQIENEICIYQKLPKNEFFPTLISTNQESYFTDIHLTKLPGTNLNDLLIKQQIVPPMIVFNALIEGLNFLYQQGFYHNDVRLWNMLWTGEKLFLFDLGLADVIEHENTNFALLWVIKQLHNFHCYAFQYPIPPPADNYNQSIAADFYPIILALKKNNFDGFLKWYNHVWKAGARSRLMENSTSIKAKRKKQGGTRII